jgi:hypothetical protein
MYSSDVFVAAHHEAAHAVVAVALGLPLQDTGICVDTVGGGVCFKLHRRPGDLSQSPAATKERERSIISIKVGYLANCKLFPGYPDSVAQDDRSEVIALLNEMHPPGEAEWSAADSTLSKEAQRLLDTHWDAVEAIASALLSKPVTRRSAESFRRWPSSQDAFERNLCGEESAEILRRFDLRALIRKETDGDYLPPDLYPTAK